MLFKPMRGSSARISTDVTPFHDGWAYFTIDDGKFYIDAVDENNAQKRICINPDNKAYVKTFAVSDWVDGLFRIHASEHGLALPDGCVDSRVFALVDGTYTTQVFAAMDTEVAVDEDENIVLSTPGNGFAGMVMLCGHYVASEQSQTEQGGGIPSGCILIWSGAADAIPTGWQLCDGSNGTPDLRGRFVLGAGTTHTVGSTGGSEEVTLTTEQMPEHTHFFNLNAGASSETSTFMALASCNVRAVESLESGESGGNQPHPNMPPYYALAYIMRL